MNRVSFSSSSWVVDTGRSREESAGVRVSARHDGAADGKGIGVGHGGHNHAGHARQSEERNESHCDDEGGGEHRRPDLASRADDALEGRPSAPGEVAEDALHHDHRRIDHDAEIDCAERNQVGRRCRPHHAGKCEEQGERQVERRDQSAARTLPRKSHSTNDTSIMPTSRFSITVWVVSLTKSARS